MTARPFETLDVSRPTLHVKLVRLNRPEVANAINTKMAAELLTLFIGMVDPDPDIRCVVMTGAGTKAFCAGGDLKQRAGMTDDEWRAQHLLMERVLRTILDCPIPVIAAVNGAAFGGGLELALAADFVYAADHAQFGLPETSLGIMPGAGGTQNLPFAAGLRRAKELVFTASRFDAADAQRWGVVNGVLSATELLQHTLQVAGRIADNAPLAIRQAKLAMEVGLDVDRRTGLIVEAEAYSRLVHTRDRHEGLDAYAERRRPVFEGR